MPAIHLPQCLKAASHQSSDLRETLIGAAQGILLAAAVFGLGELIHHSGHNPFLADEPAFIAEPA